MVRGEAGFATRLKSCLGHRAERRGARGDERARWPAMAMFLVEQSRDPVHVRGLIHAACGRVPPPQEGRGRLRFPETSAFSAFSLMITASFVSILPPSPAALTDS